MSKKKFFETGIGKFLKNAAPNLLDVVDDVFPPAKLLTKLIQNEPSLTPEQRAEAMKLINEQYESEVRDRESARLREVEMTKASGIDWMMYATGAIGLLSFIAVVYAVIWIPEMQKNDLFIHLIGMIEGVVISNLFAYYYGTSKSNESRKTT